MRNEEITQIIREYEVQNNIERISEEEITNMFGESFIFPNLYLPSGGEDVYDCISLTDYEYKLLDIGINLIEDECPEYIELLSHTKYGIDHADVDQLCEYDQLNDLLDDYNDDLVDRYYGISMRSQDYNQNYSNDTFD